MKVGATTFLEHCAATGSLAEIEGLTEINESTSVWSMLSSNSRSRTEAPVDVLCCLARAMISVYASFYEEADIGASSGYDEGKAMQSFQDLMQEVMPITFKLIS